MHLGLVPESAAHLSLALKQPAGRVGRRAGWKSEVGEETKGRDQEQASSLLTPNQNAPTRTGCDK